MSMKKAAGILGLMAGMAALGQPVYGTSGFDPECPETPEEKKKRFAKAIISQNIAKGLKEFDYGVDKKIMGFKSKNQQTRRR